MEFHVFSFISYDDCDCFSGLSAYLTTPLDVIKTRLQVQGSTIRYFVKLIILVILCICMLLVSFVKVRPKYLLILFSFAIQIWSCAQLIICCIFYFESHLQIALLYVTTLANETCIILFQTKSISYGNFKLKFLHNHFMQSWN